MANFNFQIFLLEVWENEPEQDICGISLGFTWFSN